MKPKDITDYLADFKSTYNPLHLFRAGHLLIKQKRTLELILTMYYKYFKKPGKVVKADDQLIKEIINKTSYWLSSSQQLTREEIIDMFGNKYAVDKLPEDFAGARIEAIFVGENYLLIGEYGDFITRFAYVTVEVCNCNDYYSHIPYLRHIHAVYLPGPDGDIIVTTGDGPKLLDLWVINDNKLVFKRRIRKYMAGHTAITKAGDNYFMGTDFSSRPNYIETLEGEKFFYPEKVLNMYTVKYHLYNNRYLLAINKDRDIFGGRFGLAIFDTINREYIYAGYLDEALDNPPSHIRKEDFIRITG